MEAFHLTAGAIESYLNGNPPNQTFVQVINIKKIPNSSATSTSLDKYRLQISDSIHYQPCLLVSSLTEKVINGEIDRYCIIKIEEMIPTNIQGRRILLIKGLTVCRMGDSISQVIGNPTSLELKKVESNPFVSKSIQSHPNHPSELSTYSDSCNTMNKLLPEVSSVPNMSMEDPNHTRISPISILNPYTNNWSVCARVTTKLPMRKWSNSKGEGQVFSFELADSSSIIKVTAFNEFATEYDVTRWFSYSKIKNVHGGYEVVVIKGNPNDAKRQIYYLCKADMRPANKKFCGNSNHEFELYINSSTEVEECLSNTMNIPPISYNFRSIDELRLLPKDSQVDFIGICVEVCELVEILLKSKGTQMQKREIILADKSRQKINCTLWGVDATNFSTSGTPIILIRSARVSDFNTCSLSVGSNSSLVINPETSIARELKIWYDTEGNFVDLESVSTKSAGGSYIQTFSDILSAKSSIPSNDKGDIHTFRAMISLFKKDKEIFYTSCTTDGCQKKVYKDDLSSLYRCDKCNLEFTDFKYRFMISMEIEDHSGSTWITCFKESESILGISADDLGKRFENDGKSVIDAFCDSKLFSMYYFKVRLKQEKYNDESRIKGVVLSVTTTENVVQDCMVLLKKIQSFSLIP